MFTCTVGPLATTGEVCGEPAVATFTGAHGETLGECAEHVFTAKVIGHVAEAKKAYCRRVACIELAMGRERVAHLVGTCG